MGRKPKGTPRGCSTGFTGEKLQWLDAFAGDFRTQDHGQLYGDITKQFLVRYGFDLAFEQNIPGDIEDWVPKDRREGLTGEALEEEICFQKKQEKALHQKIAGFMRNRFSGRKLHGAALKSILKAMQGLSGAAARPRQKSNLAFYSGKYYVSRLKEGFDRVWNEAKAMLPASHRISMCQDYVKTAWESESETFREQIAREAHEDHQRTMDAYRRKRSLLEESAEMYHHALESFDEVGIPLADTLAGRLGMHVMIMAVGPVGDQRGEVRLRSVFSDTSGGQTSKIWPEFDSAGFTEAEKSLM